MTTLSQGYEYYQKTGPDRKSKKKKGNTQYVYPLCRWTAECSVLCVYVMFVKEDT